MPAANDVVERNGLAVRSRKTLCAYRRGNEERSEEQGREEGAVNRHGGKSNTGQRDDKILDVVSNSPAGMMDVPGATI
jgi:hypothetical protein